MSQTITAGSPLSALNPVSSRIFNYSAGPGVLPEEVIEQAQHDLWNVHGSGMGIMEHSHRAKVYDKILQEALEDCRTIGQVPKGYQIMFMTGGATSQNFLVPANLLRQDQSADYLTTGYWAERSFEDAQMYGHIHEAWDGRKHKHNFVPSDQEINYSNKPVYVHMCSNNTIYGTQWRHNDGSLRIPKIPSDSFLVCDMCSDIYSRPLDISKFGVIYAGAQKNVGIAGVSVVIIRDDLLALKPRELPLMLQYRVMAKEESRHNTPPVFPIYMSGLVFKWILKQGGLAAIHKRNLEKAKIVYDVLDTSEYYTGHARKDSRSLMNITFRTPNEELDNKFVAEALANGMDNLKGHRATGGMRASVYNAMPREGSERLAQFMKEFERKNG